MMTQYRPGLPALPHYMRDLPLDERGYPVPFFVSRPDGQPNFQLADGAKWVRCVRENRCWICGKPLGAFKVFAVGPMAATNRISAEPPSHLDCAEYAIAACPFLLYPKAQRRSLDDAGVPMAPPPGIHAEHNPGVMALWTTKQYKTLSPHAPAIIHLGDPTTVRWFSGGRLAGRELVAAAIEDAHTRLTQECESPAALTHLAQAIERVRKLLPRELAA